jgi:hypothetical protein
MSIQRCSFSLTATSRRWTTISITFSMGTPALSAVAMVWTCVCSGDTAADGPATGGTGNVDGRRIAGSAIGGIGELDMGGIGGIDALGRSSAATSVRAASRPAARLSGVASSLMATRIESSSESMVPPRRRADARSPGFRTAAALPRPGR